jgi:proteasome lid subunit RPN8/RPN11
MADIVISPEIRDQMIRHARAELPNEACGLLAGSNGHIERFWALRNAEESPTHYRLDPRDHIRVFNEIDRLGWELKAIFHSHTSTEAYPSQTDVRQAFYPEAAYLVVSLADPDAPALRGFTIRDGVIEEQELEVR